MTRPSLDPREPVPADIYATEPGAIDLNAALISARAVSAALSMEKELGALWEVKRGDWVAVV